MKSVLFCIPLKPGSLDSYLAFAKETTERSEEYRDMLKRYDIHCAKIWNTSLESKDFIFVYHEVGGQFKEKMVGWETSVHPFDVWFRENFKSVYDIESAVIDEEPKFVLDFQA